MQQPSATMSVGEFLAWAEDRPERYEPVDGQVSAMAPERVGHAEAKFAVQTALQGTLRWSGVPCRMLPDGVTVRIDAKTAYEPDAPVYCGPQLPRDVVSVRAPVIVVEVLSPSTGFYDRHDKLAGYLSVPSIRRPPILNIGRRMVIQHAREGM